MEKCRAGNNTKESGIALVTVMVLTLVVLLLVSSLTYFFTQGFQTNILNRSFSTVFEASNGGVEFSAGTIQTYLGGGTPTDIPAAVTNPATATFPDIVNCVDITSTATITVYTADGRYEIVNSIRCSGTSFIPGYGGILKMPPKPPMAGGGISGGASRYHFYTLTSTAKVLADTTSISRTEALYRVVQ